MRSIPNLAKLSSLKPLENGIMNIVTYQAYSTTVKPEHTWIAYIVLPNGEYLGVMFRDSTNEGVKAKAEKFWQDNYKSVDADPWQANKFAGKVWVRHKETRELLRVAADEVDSYLTKGYERSGPRSK